ncbi:MAG: hypothetical protein K8E66_03310, partial [Phycisphaerales bacterium]|nr:hypothetical protein [Phycisphaerales bacterium]
GAGIGTELFATDGTAANTGLVKDVFPGPPSGRPTGMLACNGKVLFRAASPFGDEPFATDGTPAGTALIGDLEPAIGTRGSDPREFVQVAPDRFFFAAATLANGDEPYFFDGATANLLDVVPGAGSSFPRDLTLVGDTLYFTASTTATGRELFRVRPGEQPVLVQDLRPGSASSSPSLLTALGGRRLVMSANNGSAGTEVCTAENGVPGIVVHDLRQGFSSSLPNQFQVMHDPATGLEVAVFAADDGVVGRELFVTDGSTVTLGLDLEAGAAGSSPGQLAANADGTAVLFTATRGADTTVRRVTVAEANDTFLLSEEELANLARSFLVRRLFEMVLANVPIRIALMRESGTPVVGDEMYEL